MERRRRERREATLQWFEDRRDTMKGVTLPTETVFVMEMSPIKLGLGATDEIAHDARRLGLGKLLIITDRNIAELGLPSGIVGLLGDEGIKAEIYDGTEVEPTDRSMEEAAEYARRPDVRDPHGAGVVPLHLCDVARASSPRRRAHGRSRR